MVKKTMKKSNIPWILLVIVASLLIIWPMLRPGYWQSDDGEWMVIRFSAFHEAFSDGQFPVRWLQRLNRGYGYPVMNFLYPLPFYLAEIPKLLGFGFVDSIKIVFETSVIASGIGMFLFASKWGKKEGFLSSLVYLYAPYRFFLLYTRGSLGESVALALIPFIFYFADQFSKKNEKIFLFFAGIFFAGLIMAHNVIALLFTPIITLYLLLLARNKKVGLFHSISLIICGLLLSAFFWIPALSELQYTRNSSILIGDYFFHLQSTSNLLLLVESAGPIHLFIICLGLFIGEYFFSSIAIISILMLLPISAVLVNILPIIRKIQFPWRVLTVFMFASASTGAVIANKINIHNKKIKTIILLVFSLLIVLPNLTRISEFKHIIRQEGFYTTNDDTTTVKNEFTPIWVTTDPSNKADNLFNIDAAQGSFEIIDEENRTGFHYLQVRLREPITITANIHYFPGWKIYIDDQLVELDPYQSDGLLMVKVKPSNNTLLDIKFVFEKTLIRKISDYISLITSISIFSYFVFSRFKRKEWDKALGITVGSIALASIIFFILTQRHTFRELFIPEQTEKTYLNSQWVIGDASKSIPIGDSGLYAWAGWEYIHGKNPILINPEMPPLGKYLIGLGLLIFQRPAVVGLIFSLFTLISLYFLAKEVLKNKWLAITSTALFSMEPIMKNLLNLTMLDALQLGFLNLCLLFFIKGLKNNKWYILSSIMLGGFAATKFYAGAIAVLVSLVAFLVVSRNWRKLLIFIITTPLIGIIHISQYMVFFQQGNSIRDYLGVQKWIYNFYRQGNTGVIPWGSYWLLVFFNKWRVWFTDQWGVYKTIKSNLWEISWPLNGIGFLLSIFLIMKKKLNVEHAVLISWLIIYSAFLSVIIGWPHYMLLFLPYSYILTISGLKIIVPITIAKISKWKK